MADKTFEVLATDTLNIGTQGQTARATFSTAGAFTAQTSIKATTNFVESYEKITTTGSSDVADPAVATTLITSGGAHAVTLADGTIAGQIKNVIISDVSAGTITLTPANFADGTSLTMAEILDWVKLIWDGTNWNIAGGSGLAIV